MRRSSSPARRVPLAVATSVLLHAGLGLAWLLQRTPPPLAEPPTINVTLITPQLRPRQEVRPEPIVDRPAVAARVAEPPSSSASPAASPFAPQIGSATTTRVSPPSPEPGGGLAAFGRAMAARSGCRDPERLTDAERDRCTALVMAAPERRAREMNPYMRAGEHVALMAEVRHRENTAPRMSCESSRNLDPTCPNALPDNRPSDYALPRD